MATKEFTIGLPDDLFSWVDGECATRGVSRRQIVKLALVAYRNSSTASKPVPTGKKLKGDAGLKATFLEKVRLKFGLGLAAQEAGLEWRQVEAWQEKDERFDEDVDAAQKVYLQTIEQELIEIGKGAKKGVAGALATFLAAHHPAYGRIKIEFLNKIIGPLIEGFYNIIREMAGEQLGERIVTRLRELAQRKLADFSD